MSGEIKTARAGGRVPVFPLPNLVFFPNTVLPLHVFEPRYVELVRDASSGEGLIAISLLSDGWEQDYEGNPPFEPIGTIGRIDELNPLPDGRYLLNLIGLERVALGQVVRRDPYRLVEFEARVESRPARETPEILAAKLDLLASQSSLRRELDEEPAGSNLLLNDNLALETAVNGVCANLPVAPPLRQSLLEEDDLLRRLGRVSGLLNEILKRVLELKQSRGDAGGGDLLN